MHARNGEREGVSTEKEEAAGSGGKQPDERGGRGGSGGTSERDGGGKGLFESIDEADEATCLRSTPLYTRLSVLFRPLALVADVTRRYILLNE